MPVKDKVEHENTISWLRTLLNMFLIIQILNGICIFIIAQLLRINLFKYYHSSDRKTIHSHIFYLNFLGLQLIASSCIGIILSKKYTKTGYKKSYGIILTLWCLSNIMTIIYGTVMTGVLYYASSSIIELAEIQLLSGINMYYTNPEWRLLIDRLQYEEQCCGVKNFRDWIDNIWYNHKNNSDYQPDLKLYNSKNLPTINGNIPYSCSRRDSESKSKNNNDFSPDSLDNNDDDDDDDDDDDNDNLKNFLNRSKSRNIITVNIHNDKTNNDNGDNDDSNYSSKIENHIETNLQINTAGCLQSLSHIFIKLIKIIFIILALAFIFQCLITLFIKLLVRFGSYKNDEKKDETPKIYFKPIIEIHYPKDRVQCVTIPIELSNYSNFSQDTDNTTRSTQTSNRDNIISSVPAITDESLCRRYVCGQTENNIRQYILH